ncbi:MAG: peptidylprolyl isomerase [Oscillospiraceae bacterium]|nr:peptidylprolyl isomerase [Oscillospiraceae bacterium]
MNKEKTKLTISITLFIIVLLLIGYVSFGYYRRATFDFQNPIVSMEIEGHGTIKIELYPEMAPETVKNIIHLINEGHYDGLTFHRIETELSLIQGGDFAGDGSGGEEYSVPGEFFANGFRENTLSFERGVVGLARQDFTQFAQIDPDVVEHGYNTGFAQFFIMAGDVPFFDGLYTGFGRVIEGIEIVDELLTIETQVDIDEETGEEIETSRPVNAPVITRVTVETFGTEYRTPRLIRTFDINEFLMEHFGLSF